MGEFSIWHWLIVLVIVMLIFGTNKLRNMGTVGGNLCTAMPSADLAPTLITLGATARIVGPLGERCMPVERLFALYLAVVGLGIAIEFREVPGAAALLAAHLAAIALLAAAPRVAPASTSP